MDGILHDFVLQAGHSAHAGTPDNAEARLVDVLVGEAGVAYGFVDHDKAIDGVAVKETHLLAVKKIKRIEAFELRCNAAPEFGGIKMRYRASATFACHQCVPQRGDIVADGGKCTKTRNNNSFQLHYGGCFEVGTSF